MSAMLPAGRVVSAEGAAVEVRAHAGELFAYERRGTVWRAQGPLPAGFCPRKAKKERPRPLLSTLNL
nr:hypothetical protein GCM10010200_018170 [Actinomadura rugatobispora]